MRNVLEMKYVINEEFVSKYLGNVSLVSFGLGTMSIYVCLLNGWVSGVAHNLLSNVVTATMGFINQLFQFPTNLSLLSISLGKNPLQRNSNEDCLIPRVLLLI